MDVQYLKEAVGEPLSTALVYLTAEQPEDPVDFVGNFLLKYVESKEKEAKLQHVYAKENEILKDLEARKLKQLAEEEAIKHSKSLEEIEEHQVEAKINDSVSEDEIYALALSLIQKRTGASSAYVSVKIEDPEDPEKNAVEYIAATPENSFMLRKTLANEGVTFDLYKEIEDTSAVPNEDGTRPMILPSHLHIPNVMREPRMKYFRFPKLGAYLAVPTTYKGLLHDASFDPSDEAQAEGDDTVEAPNGTKIKVGKTVPRHIVLALDTLGQAREFTASQIAFAKKWANYLGKALQTAERKIWAAEAITRDDMLARQTTLWNDIAARKAAQDEAVAQALAGLGESATDVQRQLTEAELRMSHSRQALETILQSGELLNLATPQVPLKEPVKSLYCIILLCLALPSSQNHQTALISGVSQKINWKVLREVVLQDKMFESMSTYQQPPNEKLQQAAAVEDIKSKLSGVDIAVASSTLPITSALHEWVTSIASLTEALLAKKTADEDAAAAAAEAAQAEKDATEE